MKPFSLARELAWQARNDWRTFQQTRKEMREIQPLVDELIRDMQSYNRLLKKERRLSGDSSFPNRMKLGKARKKIHKQACRLVWKYCSQPIIGIGDLKNCQSGTQLLSDAGKSNKVSLGYASVLFEKRLDYLRQAIRIVNNYSMAPASILLTIIGMAAPPFKENGEHTKASYLAWSIFTIPAAAIILESLWLGAVEKRFRNALLRLDDAVQRAVPGIKEKSEQMWQEFREKSRGLPEIEMKMLYYKTVQESLGIGPEFMDAVLRHWGKK